MSKDEAFVQSNKIEIEKIEKIGNESNLKENLAKLYVQKPNGKILFMNRRRFYYDYYNYYKNGGKKDTTKLDNWILRNFAEVPAIYDDSLAKQTAALMRYMLQNKGFRDAEVTYKTKIKRKLAHTTYLVRPNHLWKICDFRLISKDDNLQYILEETKANSFFKANIPQDAQVYEQEISRITNVLRNRGYYNFNRPYFDQLQVDSTNYIQNNYCMNASLEIFPPKDSTHHRIVRIGRVNIFPNYSPAIAASAYKDTLINGLHFLTSDGVFAINPLILADRVYVRAGDIFRQEAFEKTNLQLNLLNNNYRFVSIKTTYDDAQKNKLTVNIFLTPNQRKDVTVYAEVNSTNGGIIQGSLLGGSVSLNYRDKNTFGGAELWNMNIEAGTQFNYKKLNQVETQNLKFQNDLFLPKFIDPLGFWRRVNQINFGRRNLAPNTNEYIKLISDDFYSILKDKSSTKVSMSFQNVLFNRLYHYNLFNASYGYQITPDKTRSYTLNQIGVDYLNPTLDSLAQEAELLKRTLSKQLFTGFIIRDFGYTYLGTPSIGGSSYEFRLNAEVSGLEILGINKIVNLFKTTPNSFKVAGLDYAQYFRFELDGRYRKQFSSLTSLHFRLNSAMAVPIGYSKDVPYVKQYFVGGPSGLRAWRLRELGPGTYVDTNQFFESYYYQTGDFKIEFNAELRFPLFWRLRGALFLDGGNVWTLNADANRPGSNITTSFFKEIALGSGIGFRFDATYAIIRFDAALKLRYPYAVADYYWTPPLAYKSSYWAIQRAEDLLPHAWIWNIAIGFPF